MSINFGERLISARKMAGMSLESLSVKAGAIVSKQAISKYEKGMTKPNSTVIISLSKALGVDPDYFFRPFSVSISDIEFRKRSKLTKKDENRIKYQTIDFLEKYLELEDILGIDEPFKNPISDNKIVDYSDIERVTLELRAKWGLGNGPIPHLIKLLEDKGFKIFEVDYEGEFDGLSGYIDAMGIPVIAILKKGDLVRKRFTIAHELGHLLLDFSNAKNLKTEKLCHVFACALLLPQDIMVSELGESRRNITEWELKKLKGVFGISMQAIMARARQLDIISENTYRSFNIHVSKAGWKKNEPGQYMGKERANRFKQLVIYASAEEIISFSKGAELLNKSTSEFEAEVQIVS